LRPLGGLEQAPELSELSIAEHVKVVARRVAVERITLAVLLELPGRVPTLVGSLWLMPAVVGAGCIRLDGL
jgi:hypothetical protein